MPRRPPRGFASWTAYRDDLAQAKGWESYAQKRWWVTHEHITSDSAVVGRLAAECNKRHCGRQAPTETRAGSLFCGGCNEAINPRTVPRWGTWQIRLVRHVMELRRRDRQGRFVRRPRRTQVDRDVERLIGRAS